MELNWDPIISAIVIGIVLGGLSASVAIGAASAFGMLGVASLIHPAPVRPVIRKIAYTPCSVRDLQNNDLVRHPPLGARS